jgi:hypothetical protein
MKKNKISLAKELIQLYFELTVRHPKVDEWTDDLFKERLPSLYRFQRIGSILKSFDCSIPSFIQGDFIQNESLEVTIKIHELLSAEFPKIYNKRSKTEKMSSSEMIFFFTKLMSYRKKITDLLDINSGVFAASDNYELPIIVTGTINRKISKKTKIIDRILILFLESELADIDRKTLINKFNYPDVNLMKIDIDFM